MACKARQYSDQMLCGQCGLGWDVNDPDPPECGVARREREVRELSREKPGLDPRQALQKLRESLKK